MHLKRDWRSVVCAGVLVLASVTYSQSDLPTPAPPSPNPPLERPIFVPSPPQAPRDTSPTIGPDGKVVAPKIEESRAQTRPDTSISTAPAEGFTTGGDAEPVGKVGDPLVLPFGTKGERVAIAFYSGDFIPPSNERIQPALRALAAQRVGDFNPASGASRPTVDAFILFNGRLPEGMKQQMEEAGIQFFRFYPYSAYQARIPVDLLDRLEATEMVRWVGLPNPVQKTAVEAIAYINQNTTEREWFYITGYGPDANGLLRQQLQMAGVEVVSYHADLELYTIRANSFQLSQVVSIPEAMFIEWVGRPRALHTESMASHNADRLWGGDYDGRPISGRSIKLGVADSGMNTDHQDFSNLAGGMFGYNRTSEQNWWNDLNAHGTHVSGTFFGQGNAQFRYRGFASGFREHSSLVYDLLHSKVFRQDGFAEGNSMLEGMIDMRGRGNEDVKRRIYNLSGGGGSSLPGTDAYSREADQAFLENVLPVIAAGNSGPNASTILAPGKAKGALTVGSIWDDWDGSGTNTTDTMVPSSSRGPIEDSRFKPDVVAHGRWIDSTSNTDNAGYLFGWSGTSMATPHVAGLAATLVQHYDWPAWAIRSILMGTAIHLGLGRNNQGLGKVDALLAHYAWNGGWQTWYWSNGGTGDLRYIDVAVPAGVSRMRVVLVYPDAVAPSGGSVALKNDLDLYLQTGTLTTNASGQWSSLSARNNVEVIEVNNPAAGTYRVKVYTYSLVEGSSQAWAFTIHWTFGSQSPNLNLSLNAPPAVKPSTNFTVTGTATAGSYVASGVYASLTVPSGGLTRNGLTYKRRAPNGGTETVYFANVFGKNMGNIGHTLSRSFDWSLTSGATEGTRTVRMTVDSSNGGSGQIERTVIVDGTPPTNWGGFLPTNWVNLLTPNCSIQVQDVLAGLDTSAIYYWYYTNTLGTQGPFSATTTASNGSTALETIRANSVPFNIESNGPETQVYFRAYDRAGNYSDSGWQQVRIDATPPGDWQSFAPAGAVFGTRITCTVRVRDVRSGLTVSTAFYRYSYDGGTTWSGWFNTPVSGTNGTTALQTITAPNVPFPEPSATQNKIQFAIRDEAGNWGYSAEYTVQNTATFTLTDGSATYTVRNAFGSANRLGTGAGSTDFNAGAGDRMFQHWWWYRTQGSNREYALSNLVAHNQPNASRIELTYEEPIDTNPSQFYRVTLIYQLTNAGSGAAEVTIAAAIQNQTSSVVTAHLYHYADFYTGSTNDTIRVLNPNLIKQIFGVGGCAELRTTQPASRWEMGTYPALRNKLTNTSADDLSNSTMASGDVTGAFQWTRSLSGSGGQFSTVVTHALNTQQLTGDANGDCVVDDADLLEVLFNFGSTGASFADLNCDGVVDDADLLIVLFNFGSSC